MTKYQTKEEAVTLKKLLSIASTSLKVARDYPNVYVAPVASISTTNDENNMTVNSHSDLQHTNIDISHDTTNGNSISTEQIAPTDLHQNIQRDTSLSIINNGNITDINDTDKRAARRFANVLLNKLRGSRETSLKQTAMESLGNPASYSCNKDWLLYISDGMLEVNNAYIMEIQENTLNQNQERSLNTNVNGQGAQPMSISDDFFDEDIAAFNVHNAEEEKAQDVTGNRK